MHAALRKTLKFQLIAFQLLIDGGIVQRQEPPFLFEIHPLISRQNLSAVLSRGFPEGFAEAEIEGFNVPESVVSRHF